MSEQLRMETTAVAVVSSSGIPTFAQVLRELNALRTILFTPPIGMRLLLNEKTCLDLAAHLNRIQDLCLAASRSATATALQPSPPESALPPVPDVEGDET